jgi:hypothetical protein
MDPSEAEIHALKEFCKLHIELKSLKIPPNPTIKQIKKALLQHMKKEEFTILALPEQDDDFPSYIRLIQTNIDSNIQSKHIFEALKDLKGGSNADIEESIVEGLKSKTRKYSECIKLTNAPERGIKQVQEVNDTILALCKRLVNDEAAMKAARQEKKLKTGAIMANLQQYLPLVEEYMEKNNTISQKVVIEGKSYRIAKKITVTKPKVKIQHVQEFITGFFEDHPSFKTKPDPKALETYLIHKINSVSPVTKTKIVLCNLPAQPERIPASNNGSSMD